MPTDIKYPIDIKLLNKYREHIETGLNILWNELPHIGHKLPYSAKKARRSSLALEKMQEVDKGKMQKSNL